MASLAFAVPILPGKTEDLKRLAEEIKGPRRSEFEESQRRLGVTRENWYIQETPQGDTLVVYMEAANPVGVLQGIAASQEPFERWFKEKVLEINGMDLNQPPPGPPAEVILEWQGQ